MSVVALDRGSACNSPATGTAAPLLSGRGAPSLRSRHDYGQLQEIYGADPAGEKRYSPAQSIGAERKGMIGETDPNDISTSCVERQDLTMRMHIRHPALCASHQCVLKENREPRLFVRPSRHLLQLLSPPSYPQSNAP